MAKERVNYKSNKGPFSYNILRSTFLIVIAINIIMTIVATFMYPPLVTMPHFYSYILKLGIIVLIHIAIVMWATRPTVGYMVLRIAIRFGIIAALIEIVHISMENFAQLSAQAETISTGIFMMVLFLLFAISGYQITIYKRSALSGMLGAGLSAVVCMLIVMTYGLSQLFWA